MQIITKQFFLIFHSLMRLRYYYSYLVFTNIRDDIRCKDITLNVKVINIKAGSVFLHYYLLIHIIELLSPNANHKYTKLPEVYRQYIFSKSFNKLSMMTYAILFLIGYKIILHTNLSFKRKKWGSIYYNEVCVQARLKPMLL